MLLKSLNCSENFFLFIWLFGHLTHCVLSTVVHQLLKTQTNLILIFPNKDKTLESEILYEIKYFHYFSLNHTVASGQKVIAGLRHPVTMGIHISTEISDASLPRHLHILPLARNT